MMLSILFKRTVLGLSCAAPLLAAAETFRGDLIIGLDQGGPPTVTRTNIQTGSTNSFFAYDVSFHGGVRVATGDINGDGQADIITGAGPGGGPLVKVFNGNTLSELQNFNAFTPSYTGGVYVAGGDVNGDGRADIIAGTGGAPGGQTYVTAFSGITGLPIYDFYTYGTTFSGGVRVATGDVNGDGITDIITGPGPGGGPVVKTFTNGVETGSFFAFPSTFTGGTYVAAGDVNGDGVADYVVGADAGSSPLVNIYDGKTKNLIKSFLAYDPTFTGGVRVAVGDVNGDGFSDIITGTGPGAYDVKIFSGKDGSLLKEYTDPTLKNGVFVAYSPQSVPEPATLTLLTAAGIALLRRKRK